jgi:uncharacterized protein YggE
VLKFHEKELIKMLKTIASLFLVLALTFNAQAAPAEDGKTTITVSGSGSTNSAPDAAYVNITVENTRPTAGEAQQTTARSMTAIMASLKNNGITKDGIETSSIALHPKYEYVQRKRVMTGYTSQNQVRVTLYKLDSLGKVIDAAINAGATQVDSVRFSLKDESAHKKDALQKAFRDAEGKAQAIAAASGRKLGNILRIQESSARVSPIMGMRAMAAESTDAAAETPISPGKVEVQADLSVVYELSPKQ